MSTPLYMGSTKIDASRTAGEIMTLLARAPGVRQVSQEFNGQGAIIAVNFGVELLDSVRRAYRLPINVEPVFNIINGARTRAILANELADREQAERVAWRIVLRWVQAQMAFIETGMVSAPEVFHPYMLVRDETSGAVRTVFQGFMEDQLRALPAGASDGTQDE